MNDIEHTVLICFAVVLVICAVVGCVYEVRREMKSDTYFVCNGNRINIIKDPETGVEYLLTSQGITPRLSAPATSAEVKP